jgi:DNA-directed RNA polymerase specialized sigma24 family protein
MGYSVQEIALITDSQVETVELRMFEARGQLRREPAEWRFVQASKQTGGLQPDG